MIKYNPNSVDRFFKNCIHQARITAMYKSLGSERNGVFVTVGFGRSKKHYEVVKNRVIENPESDFFIFNNILNNFL